MSAWQPPKTSGWTPPNRHVGAGQGWLEDRARDVGTIFGTLGSLVAGTPRPQTPEERRQREEAEQRNADTTRAHAWDPGRRLQEFGGQFRESPIMAALSIYCHSFGAHRAAPRGPDG